MSGTATDPLDMTRVRRAIERDPSNPVLYAILGHLHASRKEHDRARVMWTRAIRRFGGASPLDAAALHELVAEVHRRRGRRSLALREYGQAARRFREGRRGLVAVAVKDDSRVREARCLAQLGHLDRARRLLDTVRRGPNRDALDESIRQLLREFPCLGTVDSHSS
jgi:tetratricopeptide (TPR) repeat protein